MDIEKLDGPKWVTPFKGSKECHKELQKLCDLMMKCGGEMYHLEFKQICKVGGFDGNSINYLDIVDIRCSETEPHNLYMMVTETSVEKFEFSNFYLDDYTKEQIENLVNGVHDIDQMIVNIETMEPDPLYASIKCEKYIAVIKEKITFKEYMQSRKT